MNIVHISANDGLGGAARSCYRLHRSLIQQGVHSRLLVAQKYSDDPTVELVVTSEHKIKAASESELIERIFIDENRTAVSNTHFSLTLAGTDLSRHPSILAADIVHLHWVASLLTSADILRLLALGKPVVWTLHDLAPLTGGCHFTAGCLGFKDSCMDCPQLRSDPLSVPAAILRDKIELVDASRLTFIAPSRWIAMQAESSAWLRGKARIEIISNGVDTEVFGRYSRATARAALSLAPAGVYVLCGSEQAGEMRKGFGALARVFSDLMQDIRFTRCGTRILWVGDAPADLAYSNLPLIPLGRISQEERMALAYAASDLFVLPSLEDNLPNMLLEALACGIPTVAYAVGGIPEILHDGVNGLLVPAGDVHQMGKALLRLIDDVAERKEMGGRARVLATETFTDSLQAIRHCAVYENLLQISRETSVVGAPHFDSKLVQSSGLNALLQNLTIHCLLEEVRSLWQQIQTHERCCLDQVQLISELSNQLEARSEVIRDLQDHYERAEATCAARLQVIEVLESRRQQLEAEAGIRQPPMARCVAGASEGLRTLRALVRFDHWWYSKIPPLLSVAYLQILQMNFKAEEVALFLPAFVFSIACVAAYGHVVNDIFDIKSDLLAGKINVIQAFGVNWRAYICLVFVILGFAPAIFLSYSVSGCLLLALNYFWPTIYSLPGIRLKERGVAGVFCDAVGSHVTPALFMMVSIVDQADVVYDDLLMFAVVVVIWSMIFGLKGIVNHQLADKENDLASRTNTFATRVEGGALEKFMLRFHLLAELPVNLLLVCVVVVVCPLVVFGLLVYIFVEFVKFRLGFEFSLFANSKNSRASYPFVNDYFYDFWLPLTAALQLFVVGFSWWWVIFFQIFGFARNARNQVLNIRVTSQALCRRIGCLLGY